MSRIPLMDPEQLSGPLREIHDTAETWSVEHTARAFGHHPALLEQYLAFFWPMHTNEGSDAAVLDPRLKELVRLRIAELNGCAACAAHRYQEASVVGESDATAALGGEAAAFSEREQVAIAFAERMALDHHSIDDAYMAGLRRHFSEAEVLELGMMIGLYIGFGRLLAALQLETVACPI